MQATTRRRGAVAALMLGLAVGAVARGQGPGEMSAQRQ